MIGAGMVDETHYLGRPGVKPSRGGSIPPRSSNLLSLLRRLEWSKDGQCQICSARLFRLDSTHKPDCALELEILRLELDLGATNE